MEEELCGLKAVLTDVGGLKLAPVPLTGLSIAARLVCCTAEVRVSQRYVNRKGRGC
jgi:hypothetical protein